MGPYPRAPAPVGSTGSACDRGRHDPRRDLAAVVEACVDDEQRPAARALDELDPGRDPVQRRVPALARRLGRRGQPERPRRGDGEQLAVVELRAALALVAGVAARRDHAVTCEVEPEVGTVHEVVFDGPRPERALIVEVQRLLSTPMALPPDCGLIAVDQVGRERRLVAHATIPERFVAHDVPLGVYRIKARDPRFATEVLDVLIPGVPTRAALTGSASVVVRFVDADTSAPL